MKMKIEVLKTSQNENDAGSITVELHERRDEGWNVAKVVNVGEGDSTVVEIPKNGRAVLVGPEQEAGVIMQPDQKAVTQRDMGRAAIHEQPKNNIASQKPNLGSDSTEVSPARAPGSLLPGTPENPADKPITGLASQQTGGSPAPSNSPGSSGTGSTDSIKRDTQTASSPAQPSAAQANANKDATKKS